MAMKKEYPHNKIFQEKQALYNETGDIGYIWECYDIIKHAITSMVYKITENRGLISLDERVEDQVCYFIEHFKKDKNTHIDSLIDYAYWYAKDACYGRGRAKYENYNPDYFADTENLSYDTFEDDLLDKLEKEGY